MKNHRKQLEEKLWAAAEQLRANGSLKLNEITEPILGLIFLKFADVRFKRAQADLETSRKKSPTGSRISPTSPDHFKAMGVLYIPEHARYSYLMSLSESENIGKAINEAMKAIEAENRDLAGVLPQDYTELSKKADENSRILITLLKNFNQIPDDIEGDAFGEIYEYFLGNFARAEGSKGGEFFTPQSIVKLLVEVIEPYHGRIFDPACGSGGMFVQSARFVGEHLKNSKQVMEEVAIYGQEKGEANMRVAKMNLAIHGLSGKIALVNSFYEDPFESVGKFDFVLANPPFNVKGKDKNGQMTIDPARLHGDPRYYLGLPLTGKNEISNANYLWMQMFASALSKQGRAAFVMANSASDAGNAEKEIRKKMIEAGTVDIIVSVGTNMFLNATLSCTLWFFDKRKHGTDRQNKILFINAQDIYTEIDRAHSTWTDAQIHEIAAIVRRYRGEDGYEKYENIKGRCKVITLDDVRTNDYSLNPGRYVEIIEKELSSVDFDARMKELMGEFTSLTKDAHGLEQKIMEDWKSIL
ncbi:MAG: class I SAM-dependent DNA methyltransferase [Patescibacteria group bacterium]